MTDSNENNNQEHEHDCENCAVKEVCPIKDLVGNITKEVSIKSSVDGLAWTFEIDQIGTPNIVLVSVPAWCTNNNVTIDEDVIVLIEGFVASQRELAAKLESGEITTDNLPTRITRKANPKSRFFANSAKNSMKTEIKATIWLPAFL